LMKLTPGGRSWQLISPHWGGGLAPSSQTVGSPSLAGQINGFGTDI
jgi:hypothetical protein